MKIISSRASAGFAKGTRVNTREGLKCIENIRVGDYVLSSREDGTGEPEYKRVVNTFVHDDKTIVRVSFAEADAKSRSFVNATGNHPFWVECIGWTRADALKPGQKVRKADGTLASVAALKAVYRTDREGIGWISSGVGVRDEHGSIFDYANYQPVQTMESDLYLRRDVAESDDPYLRVTVYNFEVADYHNYYVGGSAFWVHN